MYDGTYEVVEGTQPIQRMAYHRENIIVPTDFIPTNAFYVRHGAMFMKSETVLIEIVDSLTERRTSQNEIIPTEKWIKR